MRIGLRLAVAAGVSALLVSLGALPASAGEACGAEGLYKVEGGRTYVCKRPVGFSNNLLEWVPV